MFTLSPTATWRRGKTEFFIVNHTLSSHFGDDVRNSPRDTEYFFVKNLLHLLIKNVSN